MYPDISVLMPAFNAGNYLSIVVKSILNQTLDFIAELEGVERTNSSVILETKLKR